MNERKYFECGFCGTEYSNLEDRMECEKECNENKRLQIEEEKHNRNVKIVRKLTDEINALDSQINSLCKTRDEKYAECNSIKIHPIRLNNHVGEIEFFRNVFGI